MSARVEHRGQRALITAWRSKSSGLLWCVVVAALGCVWWLSLQFNSTNGRTQIQTNTAQFPLGGPSPTRTEILAGDGN